MDVSAAFYSVYIIGCFLVLLGVVGSAASFSYQPQKKKKENEGFSKSSFVILLLFELAVGALIYGSSNVAAIAEQYCSPAPSAEGASGTNANMTNSQQYRISGANMTCIKGEWSSFVLALQGGRRCVQHLRPDMADGDNWDAAMMECNKRGGHSPHFYNSVDVEKMSKWIPRLLKDYPLLGKWQGWTGHKATSPQAYNSRNMSEIAWYINPTTTIGINLDVMAQQQISWPMLGIWEGVAKDAYVGMFYTGTYSLLGRPFFFTNYPTQFVYCEYENPEYVAEFIKYASKRSPAPVFNSQEASSSLSCAQMCTKYKHCMGFNEIAIAQDKKQCDLVAFIMIDLVNATLTDDINSTYYDLVVD
uniref:Apple domain-containing protein n=1 Tax=Plectus sambesii TaxID=2011161 RepID=A0A914XD73_9BILA